MLPNSAFYYSSRIPVRVYFDSQDSPLTDLRALIDIERTYGQRKPLAQRSPVLSATRHKAGPSSGSHSRQSSTTSIASVDLATPSATEGESATETDELLTETETETEFETSAVNRTAKRRSTRVFTSTSAGSEEVPRRSGSPLLSQHDLLNRYFRKDTILLHNIDLLRYVQRSHVRSFV